VTLELGGKSPAIVDRGYPLGSASSAIAYGKLANAGQTCIAPDYVLIHEEEGTAFVEALDGAVRRLYPDGPGADYTSIVNERHHARLAALLDDARAQGATVRTVGAHAEAFAGRAHTLAPTVVLGATDGMRVMQEEIFGPVLPIVAYRNLDEAIAYVNARPRPLALYFFGHNQQRQRQVLSATTSGNVTINNTLMHYAHDDLPFGGVGASGIGAYHGVEGFKSFSHAKGVFRQGLWNTGALLQPPFGGMTRRFVKAMLR
jgi:coniferyl-aldehyde dehydrogenase